jgi:hypothetical protein
MSDKQAQTAALVQQAIEPSIPAGETLHGCVYGNQTGGFSTKLYALGVTDQHLVIQQVDRKMKPSGPPVVSSVEEIKVGNIFSDGAQWTMGDKDMQIRFETKGDKYKLNVLGGTIIENALAGGDQISGLQMLIAFLRTAPR